MSNIETLYRLRYESILKPLADAVESHLQEYFGQQPRIDRISARAKSIDSFLAKAATIEEGKIKYTEPLRQIQDQVGARIVTFYLGDLVLVDEIIERYFHQIESKSLLPESEWEFGYFGKHYVLVIPSDTIDPSMDSESVPDFFELQVKTLFQHAWSEAEHDLKYKPGTGNSSLVTDDLRRLALASAQSWGADQIFEELSQRLPSEN